MQYTISNADHRAFQHQANVLKPTAKAAAIKQKKRSKRQRDAEGIDNDGDSVYDVSSKFKSAKANKSHFGKSSGSTSTMSSRSGGSSSSSSNSSSGGVN